MGTIYRFINIKSRKQVVCGIFCSTSTDVVFSLPYQFQGHTPCSAPAPLPSLLHSGFCFAAAPMIYCSGCGCTKYCRKKSAALPYTVKLSGGTDHGRNRKQV